jgi:hypothetical protein
MVLAFQILLRMLWVWGETALDPTEGRECCCCCWRCKYEDLEVHLLLVAGIQRRTSGSVEGTMVILLIVWTNCGVKVVFRICWSHCWVSYNHKSETTEGKGLLVTGKSKLSWMEFQPGTQGEEQMGEFPA